jgi:hypothetical protein
MAPTPSTSVSSTQTEIATIVIADSINASQHEATTSGKPLLKRSNNSTLSNNNKKRNKSDSNKLNDIGNSHNTIKGHNTNNKQTINGLGTTENTRVTTPSLP